MIVRGSESLVVFFFFFSSRRRHTRSLRDWSSDVCSSDLVSAVGVLPGAEDVEVAQRARVEVEGEGIRAEQCFSRDLRRRVGGAREDGHRLLPGIWVLAIRAGTGGEDDPLHVLGAGGFQDI